MTIKISRIMAVVSLLVANVQAMAPDSRGDALSGGVPTGAPLGAEAERGRGPNLSITSALRLRSQEGPEEQATASTIPKEKWLVMMQKIHKCVVYNIDAINAMYDTQDKRLNGMVLADKMRGQYSAEDVSILGVVTKQYCNLFNNYPQHLIEREGKSLDYLRHLTVAKEIMEFSFTSLILSCLIPLPEMKRIMLQMRCSKWIDNRTVLSSIKIWSSCKDQASAIEFLGFEEKNDFNTPLNDPSNFQLIIRFCLLAVLLGSLVYATIVYAQYYIGLGIFGLYIAIMQYINRYTAILM